MSVRYDSIIVGGGHNGLVCAAYLAKAGRRVLVLEAGEQLGGAAITRCFAPGYRVSAGAHRIGMLSRSIADDLALSRFGLTFAAERPLSMALSREGAHLTFAGDSVSGASSADTGAYAAFAARMRKIAAHLRPALDMVPPRLGTTAWCDIGRLIRMGWQIRSLGRADMQEFLRIAGMNVFDLVEENFTDPLLQGAVAFDAVLGSNFGPRTPGSVLALLYRLTAESAAVALGPLKGGVGSVTQAIAAAARAVGVELRTGTAVARLVVKDDCVTGVRLSTGEVIEAATVISNADPHTTFLRLLGAEHLDTGFVRRIRNFRSRGLTAKLHLALSGAPGFTCVALAPGMRLVIAPSPSALELAFNPTKYDAPSESPALEIVCETEADPDMAPPGHHVLSVNVQYAPGTLRGGWDTHREAFVARILRVMEDYAPGLSAKLVASELLTPADIEREFRITGGHWHHGELSFDQIFMLRPVPGIGQYQAPLPGLYLCGASSHPGGGVIGIAGRNAAHQVLRPANARAA